MTTIKDQIFSRMDQMSPAEKRAARTLLADYPSAGLASASALARAAGTSTPTVLRLVSRLGIANFVAFQSELRAEVTEQLNSPVQRAQEFRSIGDDDSVLRRSVAQRSELVARLLATIPPAEFDRAVASLGGKARSVVLAGGYFSSFLAQIMALQLDQVIPAVEYAAEPLGRDVGKFLALRKDSVAVIFDLRRYEETNRGAATLARSQGATVIVITDEYLSPSAEEADIVLPVSVEGIPFDSFAALMVLVEALVEGVFLHRGVDAIKRMRQWEETVHIHRAFRTSDVIRQDEEINE